MTTTATDMDRARRLWFAACKEAGLDPDSRKAIQARVAGKDSSSKMTLRDFNACLRDLQDRGVWKPKKAKAQTYRPKSNDHVSKVFAIWSDMCRDGIPDTPTRDGLISFVRRMTKSEHRPDGLGDPNWLSTVEANKVVEGLKAWRARELKKRGL